MRKKVLPLLDAARAEKNVSEKVCLKKFVQYYIKVFGQYIIKI